MSKLLATLDQEVYMPSPLVVLVASVLHTAALAFINALGRNDSDLRRVLDRWARALWLLQKSSIVLVPPARNPLQPQMTMLKKSARKRMKVRGTHVTSPLLPEDGSGDRRSYRRYGATDAQQQSDSDNGAVEDDLAVGTASFFHNLDTSQVAHSPITDPDAPQAATAVATTIFAEVLEKSRRRARLASQRLVFVFHPVYMMLSAAKCLVMVIYIQYHFPEIEGGWERLCVCGAASVMGGVITPVLEYVANALLKVEEPTVIPDVLAAAEEKEEEDGGALIVHLLLRLSRFELDDFSTVVVQGTAFVIFSAVCLPPVITLCLCGAVVYGWLFVFLWAVWLFLHRAYYRRGRRSLHQVPIVAPSGSSRRWVLRASISEFSQTFLLKTATLWLLCVTLQATLLLGVCITDSWRGTEATAFSETYFGALSIVWDQLWHGEARLMVWSKLDTLSQDLLCERPALVAVPPPLQHRRACVKNTGPDRGTFTPLFNSKVDIKHVR